jgi:L-amino acid N-acyltransferase YncA
MAEAVEQSVDSQETEFGNAVGSLGNRALHRYRDVADTRALVARKGEHVCGRVDAEESRVEILELRIAGEAQAQ